jgi:hypothetical protein
MLAPQGGLKVQEGFLYIIVDAIFYFMQPESQQLAPPPIGVRWSLPPGPEQDSFDFFLPLSDTKCFWN